jgi:hypothetical protein
MTRDQVEDRKKRKSNAEALHDRQGSRLLHQMKCDAAGEDEYSDCDAKYADDVQEFKQG